MLIFGVVATAVVAPWLARNFYYSRNPIFPLFQSFFGELFGYRFWDATDNRMMTAHLASYGAGRSLEALFMLPWRLAFAQKLFHPEAPVSGVYFFLLPLLLIAGLKSQSARRLLVLSAAYTPFWFFSSQQMRFLAPVLPLLSLAAGAGLDWAMNRLPGLNRRREARLLTALGCVVLAASGWFITARRVKWQGRLPVDQQQRDAYLARELPSYPLYQKLNAAQGRRYTVYGVGHENMVYFANGRLLGDHFGAARYNRVLSHLPDGQAFFQALKGMGVEYLALDATSGMKQLLDTEVFQDKFKLMDMNEKGMLYELVDHRRGSHPVELLEEQKLKQCQVKMELYEVARKRLIEDLRKLK